MTSGRDARRPGEPSDAGNGVDLERRAFFRLFGRETATAAGNVLGAASALRRGTSAAAAQLLSLGIGDPAANSRRLATQLDDTVLHDAFSSFRSPYRLVGDVIHLLDQRRLPGVLSEVECTDAGDVARAIRERVVRGAPVLGQVAAYGLALTATRAAARRRPLAPELEAAAAELRDATGPARNVGWAVERLMARWVVASEAGAAVDAPELLRAEADAIATDAMLDHARIGRIGVGVLPVDASSPLQLLTHGNAGALAGGLVGTVLSVVQALVADGRSVHVWVTETRPHLEGSRLTAWELRQADVPHTLIADGAAGWLLRDAALSAVLVGAEWVAANGDTANVTGTLPVALAAARAGVPFYVCAPMATVDPATDAGPRIPLRVTVAPELMPPDMPLAAGSDARHPECDVTPAELITGLITEEGLLRPPYTDTLARARIERDERSARSRDSAESTVGASTGASFPPVGRP